MPTIVQEKGLCVKDRSFLDLAFSEDPDDIKAAIQVCERCPVRLECCRIAVENKEQYGVWGGLTEGQRYREFSSAYKHFGRLPIACSFCGRPFLRAPGPSATVCRRRYCDYAQKLESEGLL